MVSVAVKRPWKINARATRLCRKKQLFAKKGRVELLHMGLGPWASRRREELLKLLDQLEPAIAELDRAVLEQANRREDAVLLVTHPGVRAGFFREPHQWSRLFRTAVIDRKGKDHALAIGAEQIADATFPHVMHIGSV